MSNDTNTEVRNNTDQERFEVWIDGKVVGLADYSLQGDTRAFTHTEVDAEFQGRGVAGQLIEEALKDTQEQGLNAAPQCSYVSAYIRKHPEFLELVPKDERASFQL